MKFACSKNISIFIATANTSMTFQGKQLGRAQKVKSFELFFKQNYQRALLLAFRFMKDEMAAQDIVQEVFLAIWERREILLFSDALRPYLFTSVKNKCLSYISTDRGDIAIDKLKEPIAFENNEFSEEDERLVRLADGIKKLPPKCNEIFQLVIFEGKKYKETADILQVSLNTVKTQLRIAYNMLRSIF
jgi:RNA polymerase sigma-70 factor (ECF subfamily)